MTIKITSQAKNVKIYLSSFHRTQQWQLWCPPMLGLVWTTSSTMTTLFGLGPTPRLPTQIGIMSDNVDSEMKFWTKSYSLTTGLVQATRSTPRTQMSTVWRRWRRRRASGTMWAAPNSWTMLAVWRPLKPVHSMKTNVLDADMPNYACSKDFQKKVGLLDQPAGSHPLPPQGGNWTPQS